MRRYIYRNIFCLLVLWLSIGIMIEWYSGASYIYAGIAAACGCMLLFTAARLRSKRGWPNAVIASGNTVERMQTLALCMMFIAGGMAVTALHRPSVNTEEIRSYRWCRGVVEGVYTGAGYTRMEVQLSALADGVKTLKTVRNVTVCLTADSSVATPGDVIVWCNRLSPITADRNKQDDVWPAILRLHGVLYRQHLYPAEYRIISHRTPLAAAMAAARDRQRGLLENSRLSEPAASLTAAIITGDRQALSTSTMTEFRLTGLSHILALSGMHIGILASLLLLASAPLHLAPRVGTHKVRWIIVAALLWGYALFTGMSASVVRACIMATTLFLAGIAERPYRSGNALALAALAVLLSDPLQLFQAGFQLSFFITALILAAIRPANEAFTTRKGRWPGICRTLSLALAAMAGSSLLTAFHFHTLPLGAFPWNLIVSLIMPAYFVAALLYSLMLNVGCDPQWGATVVNTLADAVLWCGNHPQASVSVWINGFAAITAGMALTGFMVWTHVRRRKWLMIATSSLAAAVVCVLFLPSGKPKDGFIVQDYAASRPGGAAHNAIRIYDAGRDSLLLLPDDTTLLLTIHGQRLLLLDSPRLPHDTIYCNLLLVGDGFPGVPAMNRIHADTVLLLPYLPRYATDFWTDTTRPLPPVVNLRTFGPYPVFSP